MNKVFCEDLLDAAGQQVSASLQTTNFVSYCKSRIIHIEVLGGGDEMGKCLQHMLNILPKLVQYLYWGFFTTPYFYPILEKKQSARNLY